MIYYSGEYVGTKSGVVYYMICQRHPDDCGYNEETEDFIEKYYVIACRLIEVRYGGAICRFVDGTYEGMYLDTCADLISSADEAYAICDLLNVGWKLSDLPRLHQVQPSGTIKEH